MRYAAASAAFALMYILSLPVHAAETDEQRVDQIFAAFNKADSPGCALGVIQNGSFIYRKGYGAASLELKVPLSSQSVFYMGSVSKQFTAASVVLAAEQGFLSLDDNVRKYVPEIPDYGSPVTLRHMLHHTSGFRDVLALLAISGRSALDLHPTDELIDLVARQKALNYNPGDEYLYSNTNYFLLAEVVKRTTKKPLSQFATENIFQPLGMPHTRFYDDHTVVMPGRVPAYSPGRDGTYRVNWSTNFDKVGDGGLMSSVDDLLLWDQNFYENRLGKGTLTKEMQTRGVLNSGKKISYGLGLTLNTYRGLPIVEHGGSLFGYRTEIIRFPEQHFTVVCLCNLSTADASSLSRKVADIYLEKDLQSTKVSVSPTVAVPGSDPDALAGKYFNHSDHTVLPFVAVSKNLVVRGATLKSVGANRFEGPGGAMVAFTNSDGVIKVTVDVNGETIFTGTKIEDLKLNDTALAAYAGTYTSAELDATYKLSVDKGSLTLRTNWNPPVILNSVVHDEFDASGQMALVFRREADGRVSGFDIFAGRVRNVSFKKAN